LLVRYGNKLLLIVGPVIAFGGFVMPGIGGSYWKTFFPVIVVLALGMAISVAPFTTVINAVENRYAGTASGINSAIARTATLLAVAVLGVVALAVFKAGLHERLTTQDLSRAVEHVVHQSSDRLAGAPVPQELLRKTAELHRAIDESFIVSFRAVMLIAVGSALAGALCAGIMPSPACAQDQSAARHQQAAILAAELAGARQAL
jgi:hypothetical protein